MFIALRDLRFAWGRFLLMTVVVCLVAFLTTLLSGLASGLIKNNISGLIELDFTHLAFEYNNNNKPSYRNSMIERYMWEGWSEVEGVKAVEPMGHSMFNARLMDNSSLDDVVLWGMEPGSFLEPPVETGEGLGRVENGVIVSHLLIKRAKDMGRELGIGDTFTLDRALTELTVVGIVHELNIGHVPIVYMPLKKWQEASYGPPGGAPPGEKLPDILFDYATLAALQMESGVEQSFLDEASIDLGMLTVDRQNAYIASTGYREEIMTVQMIQGFLIIISAVVIGAFFTVWTIQRTQEIGLVKALGASNFYLMRDALGQVIILMLSGATVGVAIALRLGQVFVESGFPFAMEINAAISSAILLVVAGLAGSALSVRLITRVDPIIALGAQK
jgi:putative ABC transport system permease protein